MVSWHNTPKRHRLRKWLIGLALLLAAGAGFVSWPLLTYPDVHYTLQLPVPPPAPVSDTTLAGIAVRDITPPPGIPKFGYSSLARSADGFRTRLKARAFVLQAAGAPPVTLVQLDLGAGSLLLHHLVAQRIAADTGIPAHRLSLLATHTHSGPGHYFASDFYNLFGTHKPGADTALIEFLATRISQAIIAAYQQRRPAKLAIGQRSVWGATRNRSIEAWATNWGMPDEAIGEHLAFQAVNPAMTMLRIDLLGEDQQFHPAGALTSFSIHGTALPASFNGYHADVWATLERQLQPNDDYFDFVHAPFEATHGDNNPVIAPLERGHMAAASVGTLLAQHARSLFDNLASQLSGSLHLQMASQRLNLLELPEDERYGLCERAIIGTATAGAANGDEYFPVSYLPYFQEDWPKRYFTSHCQAEKQWMLSRLQLLLPAQTYPHHALLQVIRINDVAWVTVPWEVTLEAGNVIREAVRSAFNPVMHQQHTTAATATATAAPPPTWIEVSGTANGYFGYVTTPAEYSRQYYEGGHTLYGPHTLNFLAQHLAALTRQLGHHSSLNLIPSSLDISLKARQFWPTPGTAAPTERVLVQAPVYHPAAQNQPGYWAMRYQDVGPEHIDLHRPLLRVEARATEAQNVSAPPLGHTPYTVATDEDTALEIRLLPVSDQHALHHRLYELRWYTRPQANNQRFRFVIESRANIPQWHSPDFPE